MVFFLIKRPIREYIQEYLMLMDNIFISPDAQMKEALRQLDLSSQKVLLVVDGDKKLLGALTDGDIRRSLLSGTDIHQSIEKVYNKNPRYVTVDDSSLEKIKTIMLTHKIELLPVVENDRTVADYVTWDRVFSKKFEDTSNALSGCQLVVMAGGKGTRLEPFTRILPKPLIPIGDKPIIQMIADKFMERGVRKLYFIVNYKGEMIQSYFHHLNEQYDIEYLWEKDFYGTAGGLKMVESVVGDDFFVSNCDVIIKAKYEHILEMHRESGALLTIVSAIQHYKIPYGVVQFKKGGEVTGIEEKPEFTFTVNTGLYVLNKKALGYIEENKYMDMTTLIEKIIESGHKVCTFPVNENEYIDIGQWEEYKKSVGKLSVVD